MSNLIEGIHKSSTKLIAPLSLEKTYSTVVKEAVNLSGADYGSILLKKSGVFNRVFTTAPSKYLIIPRKRGYAQIVFKNQEPAVFTRKQLIESHNEFTQTRVKFIVFIPLSYGSRSIGIIALQFLKGRMISTAKLNALKLFGSLATLAIRRIQHFEETKKALRVRDLFISLAAHELKTPLTSIIVYSQLIDKKISSNESIDTKWLQTLISSANRLASLVNEFLQVDQIKSGKLKYYWRKCSLNDIIEQAVKEFYFIHPHHSIKLTNRLSNNRDTITADYNKLLQAITNILNNAAKFSPEGSVINVNLKKIKPYIAITVEDQGVGIDKKDLSKVFDRFYKGGHYKTEGMGLGLFLTKQIIEHHRGEIVIKSKVNQGTTVSVLLPVCSFI